MAKKFLTDINIAGGVYDSSGDIGNSGQVLSSTGSGVNWINANSAASVVYQDGFTGNGSATAFTLANSIDNENKTQVYIDGVYQHKDNYSLSGTTLTFSTAPPNTSDIEVISFSSVSSADDILYDTDFASAGLMTTNGSGVYSITTNNSSNWNTAYTHSQAAHAPANAEQNVQSDWTATSGDSFIQNKPTIPSGNQIIDWTADQGSTEIHSGNYINTTYTVGDGGLTQNNFTNALKTKLDGIETSADVTDTANVTAAGALMDSELTDLAGVKGVTISNLATVSYVDTEVAGLVDSSPATLDTLNELAAALGDDPNFATTTATSIGLKAPLASPSFTGNATFAGQVKVDSTNPIFLLNESDQTANNRLWGFQGQQTLLKIRAYPDDLSSAVDALTITRTGNATFAGTVQTTQITATNGLNYLKRNTDASLQLRSENTRSGLFITKPATDTVMGSALVLADESYRLGTANYYHMYMLQNGNTYFNQNVGIGTTSPGSKLEVKTSGANTTVELDNSDTNYTLIQYNAQGATKGFSGFNAGFMLFGGESGTTTRLQSGGSYAATILENGNFGIGTTSPSSLLTLNKATGEVGILLEGNGTDVAKFKLASAGVNHAVQIGSVSNNEVQFHTANSEKMRLAANGNVGIGTTSPEQKLHVEGRGIFDGGASSDILQIRNNNGGGVFGMTSNLFSLDLASTSNFRIRQGSSVPFYLKSDGNVGIGDTSPQGKLEVSQNMSNGAASAFTSPHLRLSALNTTDSTGFVGMTFATSTADNYGFSWGALRTVSALGGMHLRYHGNSASGTDIFNIDYVGNVTIPSTRFIRSDSSAGYLIIQGGATYPGGRIEMYGGSNAAAGIIFSTGTTTTSPAEKMRITSGGNVAIGITFATAKLQIHNTNGGAAAVAAYLVNASTSLNTETRLAFAAHTNDDIATNRYSYISTINTSGSNGQDMIFATNATGASAVERIRITSDGRVGIGTTPETGTLLHLEKNSAANTVTELLRLDCGENSHAAGKGGAIVFRDINVYSDTAKIIAQRISASSASTLQFQLRGSEKMRITSEGDVLFGTTSTPNGTSVYGSAFTDETSNRMILRMASATTGAVNLVQFYNGNGLVGKIQTSGSATSYITSSDYRLKENVVEMTGALDRVSQLKPSRFNFISDADKTVDGFLAHEVQEIVPEAISGEKDAVDEEGNPKYQGIDQSKLVPLLVGAIQELKAEIETLKLQINN